MFTSQWPVSFSSDWFQGVFDDTAKARQLTDKMNRTTKTLYHVDDLASEAIDVGGATLGDLKQQGVQMSTSRSSVSFRYSQSRLLLLTDF